MSNSTKDWIHLVAAEKRYLERKKLGQNCFWSTKIFDQKKILFLLFFSLNLLHCVSKGGVPLSSDRSQLNIILQEMLLDYALSPLGFGVRWHQELRFLVSAG